MGSCPTRSPVFPSGVPAEGGSTVVLSGSGFTGATAVTFGATPATSFKVVNDHLITAVVPPGSGTVAVKVTTSSSRAARMLPGLKRAQARTDEITVGSVTNMAITSLSPTSGPSTQETVVTIHGEGFQEAKDVWFGDTIVPVVSVAPDGTELTVIAPLGTPGTKVPVIVTTQGGGFTSLPTPGGQQYYYSYTGSPPTSGTSPSPAPPSSTCLLCDALSFLAGTVGGGYATNAIYDKFPPKTLLEAAKKLLQNGGEGPVAAEESAAAADESEAFTVTDFQNLIALKC